MNAAGRLRGFGAADTAPTWPLYEHLHAEVARLTAKNNELSEALIEARNPGIDMDEVRRLRARVERP